MPLTLVCSGDEFAVKKIGGKDEVRKLGFVPQMLVLFLFVMELPAYHLPTAGNVLRSMLERGSSFIKKAGSIILVSTVVIWFLSGFGFTGGSFGMVEDMNDGILALIGSSIAFIFAPLGFGTWDAAVATLTGLVAKENVVGTMGVLYGFAEVSEEGQEMWEIFAANFTVLAAYSFLAFNLYCPPCFAAMGASGNFPHNISETFFAGALPFTSLGRATVMNHLKKLLSIA
ncbi:hypothetical protein AGMMS50268_30410 [Spirochaetia bacterium]|nr:hypothetical protein AGMMS50268_30410 [Spirochaetia bacterium]